MQLCGHDIGLDARLFLIAGPCAIESRDMALTTADTLAAIARRLGILLVYKSSFDKANRSAATSFRGPGMDEGLRILETVRRETGLPVLTDVHDAHQVAPTAEVVDIVQTPAFLARQSDLIAAVGACGKAANIKKAQFMAPRDMAQVVAKARAAAAAAKLGEPLLMVTERGTSFGYNNLVVDMRALAIMRETGAPVVFDATHAVQLPGSAGTSSGGERAFVPVLARAAVAAGVAGLFMETHPDPDRALSDGPNSIPLDRFEALAGGLVSLDAFVKEQAARTGGLHEPNF